MSNYRDYLNYVNVPIEAAKEIADRFDKSQVIIVCWDRKHRRTHVTTYGESRQDSREAAKGGNSVRKALGWPEELCRETSNRDLCIDAREAKRQS